METVSDSDGSDSESEGTQPEATAGDVTESPTTNNSPYPTQRGSSNTSIVENVIAKRGQYGRFASEWFSKQGWGVAKHPPGGSPPVAVTKPSTGDSASAENARPEDDPTPPERERRDSESKQATAHAHTSAAAMVPKILRSARLILTSRSFYFSYDFDLTRRLELLGGRPEPLSRGNIDTLVSVLTAAAPSCH